MPLTGLGAALRSLRERKGLTQRGLASAAGLSEAAISKVENGVRLPDCRSLERLLKALVADLHDLAVALDEVNGRAPRVPPPRFWRDGNDQRTRLFRELASIAEQLSALEEGRHQSQDRGGAGGRISPE